MKTVKGIWTFKDVLTYPSNYFQERVKFSSGGTNYTQIYPIVHSDIEIRRSLCYAYYADEVLEEGLIEEWPYVFDGTDVVGWQGEVYKTIDFGETEQTVSDVFYAWLTRNAFAEKVEVNITENGTTTLATAGKYCDRNIDVNVEVSSEVLNDADSILDGSFSGTYISDKITSLKTRAFEQLQNVTNISLPNCTTFLGERTFRAATNLKSVYLPNLTTIQNAAYTFSLTSLTELELPNLTSVTGTALCNNATVLKTVKLPKLSSSIDSSWFGSTALSILILGSNELNPLSNINAFANTPISSGTGYIYVPDDLVESYKIATNWSTYADQIKPISELEE